MFSGYEEVFSALESGEASAEELTYTVKVLTNTVMIERHSLDAIYKAMLADAEPEELATIEKFYASVMNHKQLHLMQMLINAMSGNFDLDLDG